MRYLTYGLPALLLFLITACGGSAVATETTAAEPAPVAAPAVEGAFGAEFSAETIVPATDLLVNYETAALEDTVTTTLRGTVESVCQAKGCWMRIAAGEEEMMVKFKDYGFFVPKDISGREVIMHGIAYYEVTPVDELRHYAEDAGEPAEKIAMITEPKRELKFLADGVQLLEGSN